MHKSISLSIIVKHCASLHMLHLSAWLRRARVCMGITTDM